MSTLHLDSPIINIWISIHVFFFLFGGWVSGWVNYLKVDGCFSDTLALNT